MQVLSEEAIDTAKRQGRQASATVDGKRHEGYLIGNRFIYPNADDSGWVQAAPGQFRELRIWRK